MRRIFHGWLSIYPVALGDYLIAWRNSLFVGLFFTFWYGLAILSGIYLGIAIYDFFSPLIDVLTFSLPTLASIVVDLAAVAASLIVAVAAFLYVARLLLYGVLVLFEESDANDVFYTAVSTALTLVLFALVLAPFVDPTANNATEVIGILILVALCLLVIAAWLYLRYRMVALHRHWTGPARVFQHDLGAALVRLQHLN